MHLDLKIRLKWITYSGVKLIYASEYANALCGEVMHVSCWYIYIHVYMQGNVCVYIYIYIYIHWNNTSLCILYSVCITSFKYI